MPVGSEICIGVPLAEQDACALLEGAGFTRPRLETQVGRRTSWLWARRARTLPDWIMPGLRMLICGLNPSLYSADVGVPFARAGNRFWKAAEKAGLTVQERDPLAALERGIGFTDCVKRATRRASELRREEYATGLTRLEQLIRRYRPQATCFVGLEGWRRVRDRNAGAGWVAKGFGGRPAYLMPSTSGLNTHIDLAGLSTHLLRAARGAPRT